MQVILFVLFLLVLSFIFAKVEIAVEGSHGWAERLPTWKLSSNHWVSKMFFGGRQATGYHAWVNLFVFIFVHFAYVFQSFSWSIELKLISFYILFWICEDFLWFVLNPAFGINRFKKQYIWWHEKNWWFFAPREYFIFIPIGIALFLVALKIGH
jgi:hypothetical protein